MGANSSNDLFASDANDPSRIWGSLIKDIETFDPCPLKQWERDYEEWRHLYKRFRDYEQRFFYSADEKGQPAIISDAVMTFQRRALFALLNVGEHCRDALMKLELPDDERKQARLNFQNRIDTLMEGLRETLELWHPVNRQGVDGAKFSALAA